MSISYSFVWNYKNKRLKADQPASVHLKVYFDRNNRRYVETDVEVPEQYWDTDKAYIKPRHPNYNRLHNKLRDIRNRIEEYEQKLIGTKNILTPQELDKFLSGQKDDPNDFIEFFRREMESDNTIDLPTVKGHKTTYNQLIEYGGGRLSFDELTYEWVVKFDRWMRDRGLGPNTIHKRHQIVARYYRVAERYKYVDKGKNPYDDFQAKKIESTREGLTEEELVKLEMLNRTGMDKSTIQVLERFLFSCYTGLRISDSISLAKNEIKDFPDGLVITKRMVKTDSVTGGTITLPLRQLFSGKPEAIALKYMKEYPNLDTLFPPMTDPAINRLLKVISQMAKLRVPLTFHIARHTFGTALADITMNPYLIMDLMGHRDIKTSMIYVHKSAERTKRQLLSITKWWGSQGGSQ